MFSAVASDGGPVAVKLLRAADGAAEACRREYQMACAVDADYTTTPMGYGQSVVRVRSAWFPSPVPRKQRRAALAA